MLHTRASGVLMALSALPSRYGIGVCGEETKRFILKIKEMGFSYWQVLPLVPPLPLLRLLLLALRREPL